MTSEDVGNGVRIDWYKIKSTNFLRFTFDGFLDENAASKAINEWENHIESGKKTPIIWDCLKMKDFEKSAAILWKKALTELSGQTGTIWLISKNPLIKLGAGMVTLVSGIKLQNVRSEEEIRRRI
jgi:hypothetical protein